MSRQVQLENSVMRQPLVGTLSYDEEGYVLRGSHDRRIPLEALGLLATLLKVPKNFLIDCSPHLALSIVQEFLSRRENPLDILTENGTVISFLEEGYINLPTEQLLETIQSALGVEVEIAREWAGVEKYSLFITVPDAFSVSNDDKINFGVNIRGSLTGKVSTQIKLAYFRVICTNGMTIDEGAWSLPRRALESQAVAFQMISESVRVLYEQREAWVERFHQLSAIKVEDPRRALLDLVPHMGLSPRFTDAVVMAYGEEPDQSAWGVLNAFTRAANNVENYEMAERLWSVGGKMLTEGLSCPTCARMLEVE